jgi:uncharacterized protein YaiL (DUF2058 family)
MSLSIRDQLKNIGLLKPEESARAQPAGKSASDKAKPPHKPHQKPPQKQQTNSHSKHPKRAAQFTPPTARSTEPSLAQAWQARDAQEKQLALEKKRLAEEKAVQKRARKTAVQSLLSGTSLNVANAELVRYFLYANKIRKVYVTAEQRAQINAGEIAIAQMDGRFHLISAETAKRIQADGPEFLALFGASEEPDVPADAGYADPKFQVPDDLVW